MVTLVGLIFCCVFVYTESTAHKSKPRAVNLALETVIEFDNKDRAYDLKFIDQVQGFLNKVKYVLKKDQNYRRSPKPELKFSDFIKSTLAIINTYEDEDLEKLLKVFNQEARKFNYRGCKFHELVQNIPFRRYIGKKLDELKEMSLEDVRDSIDEILKIWNEGKLSETNEQLVNYLDSLYEDDASENIAVVLSELDLYRRDEKQRSSMDVFDFVRKGLRSLIFDHYTKLKAKKRDNLRTKLESAWMENAEENSHNLFNSYLATDMNKLKKSKFETTTIKETKKFRPSKEEEETVKHRGLHKKSTKKSHDSDEDDDGTTKESKKEKSTSSSSESVETEPTIENKKETTTTSYDDMGEESQAMITMKRLKLLSIESRETTNTKKKHRKQSHHVAKQKTTKVQLTTTSSTPVPFSVEDVSENDKHLKFKASQENMENSDDENEKEDHNAPKEKTTEFQLKTTAALLSSMEKEPKKNKQIKKDSQENAKSLNSEDEVSSSVATTKKRKHKKEQTESRIEDPNIKEKTKKAKHKTKKHDRKAVHNNSDGTSDNNSPFIDVTTVTIKRMKKRKSRTKPTHEPRHVVAFRNFELSDQDASETKALRSTTESTLATDDAQESSDYEVTEKSRKLLTTLASNEGMSIESFEAHKTNIRKSNNDDLFHPKQQTVKDGVPNVLLNRLSELEKEIKAVKNQMNVVTEKQTKKKKSEVDTLAFWEGTSKIVVVENKDTTTLTDRTTQKYENKTTFITKATKLRDLEKSITADFKVITRDRTATTKTFFKRLTQSETPAKSSTGRITKTIKFESPIFRANSSENDQPKNKGASDKKIFISVENESPNTTFEFLVPFNFSNPNMNYEVEVVTPNVESTVNVSKQTLNTSATTAETVNKITNKMTAQENTRSSAAKLLHDENNDINEQFDADDLLLN